MRNFSSKSNGTTRRSVRLAAGVAAILAGASFCQAATLGPNALPTGPAATAVQLPLEFTQLGSPRGSTALDQSMLHALQTESTRQTSSSTTQLTTTIARSTGGMSPLPVLDPGTLIPEIENRFWSQVTSDE